MKSYMRLLQGVLSLDFLRLISLSFVGVMGLIILFLYKLGSLVGGIDLQELTYHQLIVNHQITISTIIRGAINLPYQFGLFLLQYQPFHGAGSLRILSVGVGMLASLSVYYIIRQWHTHKIAFITTMLFATSSWSLHVFRYASPTVMLVMPVVLLAGWLWAHKRPSSLFALPIVAFAALLSLYVPGLALPVLAVAVWQRRRLMNLLSRPRFSVALACCSLLFIAIVPLAMTLLFPLENQSAIKTMQVLAGLPNHLPHISEILSNLKNGGLLLLVGSLEYTPMAISGVALLDFFAVAMAIVGIIIYIRDWRLDRSLFVLLLLAYSILLTALGGVQYLIIALPCIYLLAADGISYLLSEWLSVFPRNPIARSIGISIVIVAVGVSVAYNLVSYFGAWPHTNEVKTNFSTRL